MKKYSGFTLIELLITMIVVAIAAAIALPSFQDMIKRNRTTTSANNLLAALSLARSEAAQRGVPVQFAPQNAGNWAGGWQVRADGNNDGDYNDDPVTVDQIIRNFDGFSSHSSLTQDLGAGALEFLPSGQLGPNPPVTEQFTLSANQCDSGKQFTRRIDISASGMARINDNFRTCP